MDNKVFSWHETLWRRLRDQREQLPHAILLHGRQGIGKQEFALALANSLLCETPDSSGNACGNCMSCGWIAQGSHPDYRLIEPEDISDNDNEGGDSASVTSGKVKRKSRSILIDQIRALSDLVGLTAHRHGRRVVILHPAEALNINAANALLKILEEPPPATIFILVSHQPQRLLPTIRSRCQQMLMSGPPVHQASAWLTEQGVSDPEFCLAQAGGAPLSALQLDQEEMRSGMALMAKHLTLGGGIDAFSLASHWSKSDFGLAVTAMQKWVHDLVSLRIAGEVRYFPGMQSSLQSLVKRVDLALLLDYQRILVDARATASHPLNSELQLEALLVRYAQMFPETARA